MNERILIIEDDQAILKLLQRGLAYEGYTVDTATDGRTGLILARDHTPDLVILDWMLPGMDGLEVCHRLRTGGSIPILMLTAKDTVQDRIQGLDAGADDYMIKPVRQSELLARVHALLRRAYPREDKKQLSFPPFEIDTQRGEIRRAGAKIELTPKEFDLAVVLFRNLGRLMSRGHLQEAVWGRSGDLVTRTVDTHVSQVRKKLDLRVETGYRVVPIYNYGYRLEQILSP